jgi:hypothetical protein
METRDYQAAISWKEEREEELLSLQKEIIP